MKHLLAPVFACLLLATATAHAASDCDVTIIKARKVIIEENAVTIVAEAKVSLLLIKDDHDPAYKGATWHGRPVSQTQMKADKATFIIKREYVKAQNLTGIAAERSKGVQETYDKGWEMTVKAAQDLQDGKEVGRIGYYAPEIVIKGNLIDSITGAGYLYGKGK